MSEPTIQPLTRPYTRAELQTMQERDGHVQGVLRVTWYLDGLDNEGFNDYASEELTGDESGLEDISYRLVGCDVKHQHIFVEVTGDVSSWLGWTEDSGDGEEQ